MQTTVHVVRSTMLIDLLSTMARIDNDKRIERIKQGLAGSHKGADQQRLHERIRKDLIIKQEKHQLLAVESLQSTG